MTSRRTSRRTSRSGTHRISAELREGEVVKPLELFFDLVFVLAFTQCTALMAHQPTWEGIGRGMLVLAMLWWAWVGYAWLTSVIEPEEGAVRLVMFAAMAGLIVAALCVPEAFGDRALLFAIAYGMVRAGQIALFLIASRDDPGLRRSVVGLAISSAIGIGLLIGASFLAGGAQEALWGIAILVDWGGPALFGMRGWKLVPGHFAERHSLVIILALGESIIALGVGAQVDLTAGVITAAVLGIGLAAALWWTYFDVVALVNARRLTLATEGRERNMLARDSYSYLHFPMVAGIVLAALGLEETLAHIGDALDAVHAFALLGGVAVYLLAHVALRLRNAHTLNRQRLLLAVLLLALIPIATTIPSLATLAGVNVLLWAMIGYETANYDERRYRLRHGLDPDPPSPLGGERG
ncbi:MAG TPA: low temperature requirement protein A [Acidimicrobiia bacterium]